MQTLRHFAVGIITRTCLGVIACSLLFSCNKEDEKTADNSAENGTVIIVPASGSGSTSRLTTVPISFQNSQHSTNVFSLLAGNPFTLELTGCLSGYTSTVTEANFNGLEIYNYDRECLAKLTEFSANGRTYVPTVADPFTTWQVGDSAIFDELGEPGVAPLRMVILSTLESPATANDKITYGWASIAEGSTNAILWSTVGVSGQVPDNVPNLPPSFSIRSVEFLGFSPGEGGQYKIVLECNTTITITNICDGVDFTDLDYKLVTDSFGGTIDLAAGDTIFSTPGNPVTLPGDRVAPGDSGTINGGFVTVTLDGPDNLAANPNMLFVIRSYESSYQFFNLDISVSANY